MLHVRGLAAIVVVAALTLSSVRAEGFDARPITIETRDGLASIVVTNPVDRPIYLEAMVREWSQDAAGRDVLVDSETAVALPPATWVSPRSTYNLRVRLPPAPPGQERAFRVLIRQIPRHPTSRLIAAP